MPKPTRYRLNNRIVTFLTPRELQCFRENNLCSAELMRAALRTYLHLDDPMGPYKA